MDPEFSLRFAIGCVVFWGVIAFLIAMAVEGVASRGRSLLPRTELARGVGAVIFILGTLACLL